MVFRRNSHSHVRWHIAKGKSDFLLILIITSKWWRWWWHQVMKTFPFLRVTHMNMNRPLFMHTALHTYQFIHSQFILHSQFSRIVSANFSFHFFHSIFKFYFLRKTNKHTTTRKRLMFERINQFRFVLMFYINWWLPFTRIHTHHTCINKTLKQP